MNTISNDRKIVKRLRRRIVKIVINIYTSRVEFKEITIKELDISKFINIYNYYMNKVDNAD